MGTGLLLLITLGVLIAVGLGLYYTVCRREAKVQAEVDKILRRIREQSTETQRLWNDKR